MGSRRVLFGLSLGGTQKEEPLPEIHIVLLGQLGVGKSALTVKFLTKRFIMEYDPTLEGTYNKVETLDGQDVCVKVMDTYQQEDGSESDDDRYYRWAHGYIIVYSITSRASFERAKAYLNSVSQYQHKQQNTRDPPIALVGNKVDLERYRTVSKSMGESLAAQCDCSFHETSAAEDFDSVEGVFHSVIRDVTRGNSEHPLTPLQPLVISEEKSGGHWGSGVGTQGGGSSSSSSSRIQNIRRVKSPKVTQSMAAAGAGGDTSNPGSSGKKTEDKEQTKTVGNSGRRPGVGLKLFKGNKGFKIFN